MFGFGESKKGVGTDTNWRKLEREGEKAKHFEGYVIKAQKQSKSTGKRPDYFGYKKENPHHRIVGDAKCVKELTTNHVEQVKSYKKHPFYAKEGVLIVAKDTKVPHDIRAQARANNISIERTNVSQKKGFFDKI
jgi:hypothetical protein